MYSFILFVMIFGVLPVRERSRLLSIQAKIEKGMFGKNALKGNG